MTSRATKSSYLTKEDVDERLKTLGFILDESNLNYPPGFQLDKFQALQEIIVSAIAEWTRREATETENYALLEWTEEYLVG